MDTQQPKHLNVLIIGDSCIDKYHYGTCERLSPEAPVPVLKHQRTEEKPGMALNVMRNLISHNIKVDILTNEHIITKERFIDGKSNNHLLRFDSGEAELLTPISLDTLSKVRWEKYDGIAAVDYNKGTLQGNNILFLSEICKDREIPFFVDSKKTDLSQYEHAFIKINNFEHEKVESFPSCYELIITHGKNGALHGDTLYPSESVEVHDVCGAGDTFFASFISMFLISKNIGESIKFANKCAKITVTKSGVYAPTKEDLKNENICF